MNNCLSLKSQAETYKNLCHCEVFLFSAGTLCSRCEAFTCQPTVVISATLMVSAYCPVPAVICSQVCFVQSAVMWWFFLTPSLLLISFSCWWFGSWLDSILQFDPSRADWWILSIYMITMIMKLKVIAWQWHTVNKNARYEVVIHKKEQQISSSINFND